MGDRLTGDRVAWRQTGRRQTHRRQIGRRQIGRRQIGRRQTGTYPNKYTPFHFLVLEDFEIWLRKLFEVSYQSISTAEPLQS